MSHENGQHDEPRRGLLVDWGGVMTTSVFDTFRGFCEAEGLDTDAVAHRFRHDPASRELLIGLETGTLPEEDFEPRFAALLGVSAPGLIERMFSRGTIEPEMVAAVRRAREAGVQTGQVAVGLMERAKGLEFRAVAVLACDEAIIPSQARIDEVGDYADLEDTWETERQLLYVACTRARDHLLVTGVAPGSEFLEDLIG